MTTQVVECRSERGYRDFCTWVFLIANEDGAGGRDQPGKSS
jgi:hypothetical protein